MQEMSVFLKYANYVFTAVFIIEGILKIYALGLKKYIKERYAKECLEPNVSDIATISWLCFHCFLHSGGVKTPATPVLKIKIYEQRWIRKITMGDQEVKEQAPGKNKF